jgi:hypothetical protein
MESKPWRDSLSRTTHLAIRPWRVAFLDERLFPAGVIGPFERAPLALDEIVRRIEDIAHLHLHFTTGVAGGYR